MLGSLMFGITDAAYDQWVLRVDLHQIAMYGEGRSVASTLYAAGSPRAQSAGQRHSHPKKKKIDKAGVKMAIGVQTFRGERLTEARLARGLYRKTLGDMLGITGSAITRYEEGKTNRFVSVLLRCRSDLVSGRVFPEAVWQEKLEPFSAVARH